MAIVTRAVGLGCILSTALITACGSSSGNNVAAAGFGAGGESSAGTSDPGAGSSNAGSSNAGSSNAGSSNAGSSNAGSGAAGSSHGGASGMGGTGSGGTVSSAGAAGKTSGGAGAAQAGAGGTQGGSCADTQVLFLIQRSGALFEQPGVVNFGEMLPVEASYFGFLQAALAGDGGAAKAYSGKFPIGVSFLFAVRDTMTPLPLICPQFAATVPTLQSDAALAAAFNQSVVAHAALVTAKQKEEAPVPEAIASTVASWSASGPRHLVLVTMAMPDTCTLLDGPCGIDATVNAVQVARAAGVTTHVIGLGDHAQFNYLGAADVAVETGYEEYLQQLANAGSGKPLGPANVEKLQDYACGSATPATLTATYSATPGDAKYYQVKTATDAKTAVAEILAGICP